MPSIVLDYIEKMANITKNRGMHQEGYQIISKLAKDMIPGLAGNTMMPDFD